MMIAALIFAATFRYQSILSKYDKPVFEAGASQYEFYAEGDMGGGRKVVVYGFTPVRRDSSPDVPHQVFVAMVGRKGDGYELVSGRRDVTDSVFNIGERGRFTEIRARVNPFVLRSGHYVDITLWSSISGSGPTSSANDLIYRVANDGALVIAAKLDETEAFSRNGWREIRQTSSDLSTSAGEGALVWTKKERMASRDKAKTPFRVNCQTTRTTYRPLGRSIVPSAAPTRGRLKPLSRVPGKEIVPCCSGCELRE